MKNKDETQSMNEIKRKNETKNKNRSKNKNDLNNKNEMEKNIKTDTMQPQESSDYEFIKEQIKDRPVNKKKLVRRMFFTAGMAVMFSLIACISFLLLEPVLEDIFNPEESMELNQVTLPEVPEEDEEPVTIGPIIVETPLEDMSLTDEDVDALGEQDQNADHDASDTPDETSSGSDAAEGQGTATESENSAPVVVPQEIGLSDYQLLYRKLYALSAEVSKSIVTVTGITSDVDWMNETYLSTNQTTGLIIADNGYELLILADNKNIKDAESVRVTFIDDTSAEAFFKQTDVNTGLSVYAVNLSDIREETKETITAATLGSSYATSLLGNAVIAIGNPLGSGKSVCYGAITSMDRTVSLMDANYQLLTTDIYGSKNANGVLINIKGQVVGFITQDYNSEDMQNLIYAYGISSIRQLVQSLSNGDEKVSLGLYLSEVPQEAMEEAGLPSGVYVTDVRINMPAMNYGLAKGDVITMIGDKQITSVNLYMQAISELSPGDVVTITYARLSNGIYKSMEVDIEIDGGI